MAPWDQTTWFKGAVRKLCQGGAWKFIELSHNFELDLFSARRHWDSFKSEPNLSKNVILEQKREIDFDKEVEIYLSRH